MLAFRIAASLLLAAVVFAQTRPVPDYAVINYYRSAPGMASAYEAKILDKTVKITQEVMKGQPDLISMSAFRLEFGGMNDEKPDYLVVQTFRQTPIDLIPAFDQAAKKLFNQSWADVQKEYQQFRTPVGRTIIRMAHQVGDPPQPGDWVRVQRNKSPGGPDEYVNILKIIQPLREAQVKAGKIRGFSLWSAVSNVGTQDDFSSLAASVAKDLGSLLGANADLNADNAKLAQPVNLTSYVMRLNEAREIRHSDIYRAFAVIRPAQ
jgi:hypothetical protein